MSKKIRKIAEIIEPVAVLEGAGVRLKRLFPTSLLDFPDPFLLFDHFGSDNPDDYIAGFPMHPHRGIETVTYMLAGAVHHRDSIENSGTISAGDVQWMTAGRGIMHEEMPKPVDGLMVGFQLWVNLPAGLKMTKPRYQEFAAQNIPSMTRPDGVIIRVITGRMDDIRGPVTELAADPLYMDVQVPPETEFTLPVLSDHTVLVYMFEGMGAFERVNEDSEQIITSPRMLLLSVGDLIRMRTNTEAARFLIMSGKPSHESIVRYGPFVMNTQEEIEHTLRDLRNGTFIRP